MLSYRKAHVLPRIQKVAKVVQDLVLKFPDYEKFALASQMRRSSSSILFNFAEGFGRGTRAEIKNFLIIARGSAYELDSQLVYCDLVGYTESTEDLQKDLDRIVYELNLILAKYGFTGLDDADTNRGKE